MSDIIIGKTFKCKRCIGNNCFCRYFKNNCSDISNERCIWKQNFILEQKLEKIQEIVLDELNLKFDVTGKLQEIEEIIGE